jgi:hypothetical protein
MTPHHRNVLRACLSAAILGTATTGMAEVISFPSRAADLPAGTYWTLDSSDEGCCVLDLTVTGWDGDSWVDGEDTSTNEGYYTWNVPYYAPANGYVASCWRNFPDDPSPGVQPPNNEQIFGGGNHMIIITDQGNAISINHMKSGSIPAGLCPPNDDSTQFPDTTQKQGDWRVAAYIDPADRPRVTEGDFIGRAGNSGRSSNPHLHFSMSPVVDIDTWGREELGDPIPFGLRDAWAHAYDRYQQTTVDGWYRFRGGDFVADPGCTDCTSKMVLPSPYLRRAEASAGAISNVDTAFISGNRAVTAVVDGSGNLKLVAWDLVGVDEIVREADIQDEAAKEVQLVEVASDYVLVAVRTPSDYLRMVGFQVTPFGDFIRIGDYTAGKIGALALAVTSGADRKAVTAVREQNGNLKVIAWDIAFPGGTPTVVRLGSQSAGAVSAVAIAPAGNFHGVITAVRDSGGNLKMVPWKLSSDGNTITRGTDASAGAVGPQLAVAPLAQGVAAAVRDADGDLRMTTWTVSSSGNMGAMRDDAAGGAVSEVRLQATPYASSNLTMVVRDGSGELLLVGWLANADGTNLRRAGSSEGGAATKIAVDGVGRSYPGLDPRDMILTAMRDGDGELKLVTWDTNLVVP